MQRKSRRFTFFWDRFIVPCSLPHLVFHGFLSLLGDVPISELTDESFQGTIFKLLSYVFPCFFLIFMGHQWFFPNFYGKPMVNLERSQKRAGGKAARGLVGPWFLGSLHGKITSTYLFQKGDLPLTLW